MSAAFQLIARLVGLRPAMVAYVVRYGARLWLNALLVHSVTLDRDNAVRNMGIKFVPPLESNKNISI